MSPRAKKPPNDEPERRAREATQPPQGASDPHADDQPGPATTLSSVRAAGERAILNTVYRSGGEIVGRFASLLLFAFAARKLGENGLGAFVFGIAFAGFVMILGALGLDRYTLRAAAEERSSTHTLFFNVMALKLAIAVPLFTVAFLVLHLVGYSHQAQLTALVLVPGVVSDSIARTQLALFSAHERNGPPATADTINRVSSAALGILALSLGYGAVSVGISYSIGSMLGVGVSFVLMARTIGVPTRRVTPHTWRSLASSGIPFAAQDVFSALLAKADTLILSLLATQATVGIYGAAYRLFESTLLVPFALVGAFSAMYTYLGPDTSPSLRAVVQRSIKASLVLLMPLAVAFVVVPEPICKLIYGSAFASAAVPLQILGPGVALIGFVTLTTSLMFARGDPRPMASRTAIIVVFNIALNFILIPLYGAEGAAAAMLATELVFALWLARLAVGVVGGIRWLPTLIGSLAAGAAMAVVGLALHHNLLAALVAGGAVYLLVLLAVEWLVNPLDVVFVADMVRRRLSSRPAT